MCSEAVDLRTGDALLVPATWGTPATWCLLHVACSGGRARCMHAFT